MWGEHNLEGEWSKSKSKKKGRERERENDQRTPSLSLEKLPLFVHMLRGFLRCVNAGQMLPDEEREVEENKVQRNKRHAIGYNIFGGKYHNLCSSELCLNSVPGLILPWPSVALYQRSG
jgi:hypothetical protein